MNLIVSIIIYFNTHHQIEKSATDIYDVSIGIDYVKELICVNCNEELCSK